MKPIFIILIAVFSACASTSDLKRPAADQQDLYPAAADSISRTDYEDLFVEIHSGFIAEIGNENDKEKNPVLIEIWTIVKIAEDAYLRGDPLLAIKLLSEAEILLRQTP